MTAVNGGRSFVCTPTIDSVRRDLTIVGAKCAETKDSGERALLQVVVTRLALETNCPASEVVANSTAAWNHGSDRAFRLTRTHCKAALDQGASPPPPPQPLPTTL